MRFRERVVAILNYSLRAKFALMKCFTTASLKAETPNSGLGGKCNCYIGQSVQIVRDFPLVGYLIHVVLGTMLLIDTCGSVNYLCK